MTNLEINILALELAIKTFKGSEYHVNDLIKTAGIYRELMNEGTNITKAKPDEAKKVIDFINEGTKNPKV